MRGIKIIRHKSDQSLVCHVNQFSSDLKKEIKNRLVAICHGGAKSVSQSKIYSYKETLKEFCKRYNKKAAKTKKGMIGELLSHIIIVNEFENLLPASPYFNLEEKNIKKGFDIIFYDDETDRIWITEVKSGETKNFKSNQKNLSLINKAKNDLKDRLNDKNRTIWLNAINGANVALKSGKVKDKINQIIESIADDVVDDKATSSDKDVILVSVLFKDLNDAITIASTNKKRKSINNENIFGDVMVLSIQKETYQKVADYLKKEALK